MEVMVAVQKFWLIGRDFLRIFDFRFSTNRKVRPYERSIEKKKNLFCSERSSIDAALLTSNFFDIRNLVLFILLEFR
jgi:hypothetical protein